MKYDFTSILDRRGKDAIAVDAPYVEGCFNHEYFAAATLKGWTGSLCGLRT